MGSICFGIHTVWGCFAIFRLSSFNNLLPSIVLLMLEMGIEGYDYVLFSSIWHICLVINLNLNYYNIIIILIWCLYVIQLSWTFEKQGVKLEWRCKKPSPNNQITTASILDFLLQQTYQLSLCLSFSL